MHYWPALFLHVFLSVAITVILGFTAVFLLDMRDDTREITEAFAQDIPLYRDVRCIGCLHVVFRTEKLLHLLQGMENTTGTGTEKRTQRGGPGLPDPVSQTIPPGRVFAGRSQMSPEEQTICRCGYLDQPRLAAKRRPGVLRYNGEKLPETRTL